MIQAVPLRPPHADHVELVCGARPMTNASVVGILMPPEPVTGLFALFGRVATALVWMELAVLVAFVASAL